MNDKNETIINRNYFSFNKSNPFRKYFMERENKRLNEGIFFKRATSEGILNTNGEKPLVIYSKSSNKCKHFLEKRIFQSQFDINNNYISDGGLKQKNKKFLNLLSKYPINYKFHSPIKIKKEILQNLKYKKYKSLSFSNKILSKNRTIGDYNINNEKSNLFSNTNKKKLKNKLLYNIEGINNTKNNINLKGNGYSYTKSIKIKNKYKLNLIKHLIKNKTFINEVIKNNKNPKLIFIERKKQVLKRNGIDISHLDIEKGIDENEMCIKEKNNNEKNKIKNILKDKISKIKSNGDIGEIKNKKYAMVNQFEYIKKIFEEYQNLNKSKLKLNNFIKINKLSSNININKTKNNSMNIKIIKNNYALRQNKNKLNSYKINNENTNEETNDEYPYSHKISHRDKEELKEFNKLKKIKQKNILKKNEEEKKRKLYIRFQNLFKLNLENINSERLHTNTAKTAKMKNIIKKRREKNKYYVGNEISKNNSTFIEQNDYYFSLYQSQQVITNSNIDISKKIIKYNHQNDIKYLYNNNKKIIIYNNEIINKFINKLKIIFIKKGFTKLYMNYNKIKYYYHFYLSINYFIAIIKQYPFNQIYLYYLNQKEISTTGKQINEQKIIYFQEVLSLIFKIKIFEKIFNYSQQIEIKLVKEKLEKMICIFIKFYLKNTFEILKDTIINKNNNYEKEIINDNINNKFEEEKNSINEDNNDMKNQNIKLMNLKNENIKEHEKKNRINQIELKIRLNANNKINLRYSDIKNEEIKNNEDISAERDNEQHISWEYNCSSNEISIKELNQKNNKTNNFNMNEDVKEYEGDFHDIKSFSEDLYIFNDSKADNNNEKHKFKEEENINIIKNDENNIIEKNQINNHNKINIGNKKDNENINFLKSKGITDINKFTEDLTKEIIKHICNTEISSKQIKLIPNKSFQHQEIKSQCNQTFFCSKELDFLDKKNPLFSIKEDSLLSSNDSLIFSSSTYSMFNKNIKDKKNENSVNLYKHKIVPKLIKLIQDEIIKKHKRILDISPTSFNNKSKIMISLSLKDNEMLKENYKLKFFKESIEDIIDKKNILKKFEKFNNEIRIRDNITSDNYYDKILNECIVDAAIELIDKERNNYLGHPPIWTKEKNEYIHNNYISNNPKKFADYICKGLISLLNKKLGIISDNLSPLNIEKINTKNENNLTNMIKEEIKDEWENLEIEETKIKLEIEDYIFEMLIRENIEILEHVQNNRIKPYLYNYKSIYGCSDMPQLDFQKEDNENYFDNSEDDIINM